MAYAGWIAACLLLLVLAGLAERLLRDRAWAAIPIRIHVNGTRGKSTVTRLIWAGLREAGIPAMARCTGTAARLLLPDGSERPWRRRGRANIREELRLLLQARRSGARALVVECMAVQPELQWIAEHRMVSSTVGVITNVRTDHTESMGRSLRDIAASLANTIPRSSVLILGERKFESAFRERAHMLGTRIVIPSPEEEAGIEPSSAPRWLCEDLKIATAVTRELGIPDAAALAGMARCRPDAGAAHAGALKIGGKRFPYLDASAANDPESLQMLASGWRADENCGRPLKTILIYNHRADRPDRLLCFSSGSVFAEASDVWVTGEHPALSLWWKLRRARHDGPLRFVPSDHLAHILEQNTAAACGVIFCGNTRGLDLSTLIGMESHG